MLNIYMQVKEMSYLLKCDGPSMPISVIFIVSTYFQRFVYNNVLFEPLNIDTLNVVYDKTNWPIQTESLRE